GTGRPRATRRIISAAATTAKKITKGCASTLGPNGLASPKSPDSNPPAAIRPYHQSCARPAAERIAIRLWSHLHALLGEIFHRTGMPGNRRVLRRLVLERDARGFAVHGDELVTLLDEGPDDVVGDLVGHLGVGDQDILDHADGVVLVLAGIGLRRDHALRVQAAV